MKSEEIGGAGRRNEEALSVSRADSSRKGSSKRCCVLGFTHGVGAFGRSPRGGRMIKVRAIGESLLRFDSPIPQSLRASSLYTREPIKCQLWRVWRAGKIQHDCGQARGACGSFGTFLDGKKSARMLSFWHLFLSPKRKSA